MSPDVSHDHDHEPRSHWLGKLKRVVVKLGSSTVLGADLDALAKQVAMLRTQGVDTLVVTSGAVAMGMRQLGLTERPKDMAKVQALAAVGQSVLMMLYQEAFAAHGLPCAQILLTHEALSDRTHFLNVRHTLSEALAFQAVPIVNENDTVAVEELRFGDNDRLAAALATVADADLVILLSDVDALYDADPRRHSDAQPVRRVTTEEAFATISASVDGAVGSAVGTGGMRSKVQAAELAISAGIPLVVASGDDLSILGRIVAGEEEGTLFCPLAKPRPRRLHWIAWLSKVKGTLTLDSGAVEALQERGSSLLAAGIVAVEGAFERGDSVELLAPDASVIGRGLAGYDSVAVGRILGQRTGAVAETLGLRAVDPVVHRDDLDLDPI